MNVFRNKEYRLRAGWRVLIQFILWFLGIGFISFFLHQWLSSPPRLLLTAGSLIATLGSVWFCARLLDRRRLQDYGLHLDGQWFRECVAGVALAGLAISCVFIMERQMGWITLSGYAWERSSIPALVLTLGQYLLVMLMVGFYEELFSRGYQVLNLTEGLQYSWLGSGGAAVVAVLLTSILFGFLHMNNPNASLTSSLNIVVAGVVLAIPYLLTGSLAVSVGLHIGWNFVQGGIYGFPVSGMPFHSPLLQIEQHGPPLWTGGAFGPEAGLAGFIGMAIMLGGSCVYIQRAGHELALAAKFR